MKKKIIADFEHRFYGANDVKFADMTAFLEQSLLKVEAECYGRVEEEVIGKYELPNKDRKWFREMTEVAENAYFIAGRDQLRRIQRLKLQSLINSGEGK